jgi:hypothetical protein
VRLDGRSIPATPTFGFWEAGRHSILKRLPLIVERIATFRGPLGYVWLVWTVLGLAVLALTAGISLALWQGTS